jgi:dsRNA-specific ribonuclease
MLGDKVLQKITWGIIFEYYPEDVGDWLRKKQL